METLPEELFDFILSLAYNEDDHWVDHQLPVFATVSRRWQYNIERRTFRNIRVNTNELEKLGARFTGSFGHRAAALSGIECSIILPCCSDDEVRQRETDQDVEKNNRAISEQLQDLFNFLFLVEQERKRYHSRKRPLALEIRRIEAPTDRELQNQDPERFKATWEQKTSPDYYWSRRWRYNVHSLLQNEVAALPEIQSITYFEVPDYSKKRQLRPGDWIRIAAKFPYLENLKLTFSEHRAYGKKVRRKVRRDFADSLYELVERNPPALHSVTIERNFSVICDEAPPGLDYSGEGSQEDKLDQALSRASQRLTCLWLKGLSIGPDLFRYCQSTTLRNIDIQLDPLAPNGEWYFTTADGTDIAPPRPNILDEITPEELASLTGSPTPYETGPPRPPSEAESVPTWNFVSSRTARRYRVRPRNESLSTLLIAAAKGVRHMPSLERLVLYNKTTLRPGSAFLKLGEYRAFAFTYAPKGRTEHFSGVTITYPPPFSSGWRRDGGIPQLSLCALPWGEWKPDAEVREEWARTLGNKGAVHYVYGEYWELCSNPSWHTLSSEEFRKGFQPSSPAMTKEEWYQANR